MSVEGSNGTAQTFRQSRISSHTDGERVGETIIVVGNMRISTEQLVEEFSAFFSNFGMTEAPQLTDDDDEAARVQSKYESLLWRSIDQLDGSLAIDMNDVYEYQPDNHHLYTVMVRAPRLSIAALDQVVSRRATILLSEWATTLIDQEPDATTAEDRQRLISESVAENMAKLNLSIKPYNLRPGDVKTLVELGPADIDHLVQVKGMVTKCRGRSPEMVVSGFVCTVCGNIIVRDIEAGNVDHPTDCSHCQTKGSYDVNPDVSEFIDMQRVTLQEAPDKIPPGETPTSVNVHLSADLVSMVRPGDRVDVVGIYRATPQRAQRGRKAIMTLFKAHIDLVYVMNDDHANQRLQSARTLPTAEAPETQHQILQRMAAWAEEHRENREEIYDTLIASLAPSVIGHTNVKRGLLCQLVGGVHKESSGSQLRGEIHVLLVGDPGVAKSQLLKAVNDMSTRGVFTSGKGSSAVGLTASVNKDPDSGEMMLEVGALVLSDGGICCIDEFDKMSEQTRTTLHEIMEQQSISVAKAGIVSSLRAKTAVLAAANPRTSRYDPNRSVVANINLGPTLLSRFDLIYLMLDNADEATDRKTCYRILKMQLGDIDAEESTLPVDLKDYIAFAKNLTPVITDAAGEVLLRHYVGLRNDAQHQGSVAALPRVLESMVRLSEAFAKLRLSEEVDETDAQNAYDLMYAALLKAAYDPITHRLDMSILTTGVAQSERRRIELVESAVRQLLAGQRMTERAIIEGVLQALEDDEAGIPEAQARALIITYLNRQRNGGDAVRFTTGRHGVGGVYHLRS